MNQDMDFHTAKALLDWQVELGVTDAICDTPINRYEIPEKAPKAKTVEAHPEPVEEKAPDGAELAAKDAAGANDLDGLRAALSGFEACNLKRGARGLVFSKGSPSADVMIIGDAPDREDEKTGEPMSGMAGVFLDKMFGAIGRTVAGDAPETQIYVTNILPWRVPQNRDPQRSDLAMMAPFVRRHIAIAQPKVVVIMGNLPLSGLFGKTGISRMRGEWMDIDGTPVILMQHPLDIMRSPSTKRLAWSDLLALKAKLRDI